MLRHDPCPTPSSSDSTTAGRWNASTSFEATMPITPRCQPSPATTRTACDADVRIVLDRLLRLRQDRLLLLLPPQVLVVELRRQAPAPPRPGPRRRPAAAARRCPACHPARRVQARREDERRRGSCRSPCPLRPDASSSARRPTLCGPRESRSRPSFAITRFSPTSGTTSASVPIAAILTNAGSQRLAAGLRAQRLHQLQRDADAGQVLVRVRAVARASG